MRFRILKNAITISRICAARFMKITNPTTTIFWIFIKIFWSRTQGQQKCEYFIDLCSEWYNFDTIPPPKKSTRYPFWLRHVLKLRFSTSPPPPPTNIANMKWTSDTPTSREGKVFLNPIILSLTVVFNAKITNYLNVIPFLTHPYTLF